MQDMEAQLRMLMNIAAGDPPRRVDPDSVRRAARRRSAVHLAAAAAIMILGGAGVALASQSSGPAAPVTGGQPAGPPRYYIVQSFSSAGLSQPTVRATATGAVTSAVRCPWRRPGVAVTAIAPARNMSFFIACQRTAKTGGKPVIKGTRIFRFWISRSGRPAHYSAVRGGELPGLQVIELAAARDGSKIAVATVPAVTQSPAPADIVVISTATGAHAVWHPAPKVAGKVWYGAHSISLTGNGGELVFLAQPRCVRGTNAPPCKVNGGEEVRALSPADRGGQITSSRLLLKQARIMRTSLDYINAALISPDGSTLTLAVVGSGQGLGSGFVRIEQVPASTGTRPRIVYQMNTGNGFLYRMFGSDASGRFFLLDAGPSSGSVNGWIDHGQLVRLKPAAGENLRAESW